MERCRLLAEKRKLVEKGEMREWRTRHSRNQLSNKIEKGPVEPGKEEEEDKLESFFCHLYEFHNPVPVAPAFVPAELPPRYAINFIPAVPSVPVSASPANLNHVISTPYVIPTAFNPVTAPILSTPSFVPAGLPARYAIDFVPAVSSDSVMSVPVSASSNGYSVVSSANFVIPPSSVTVVSSSTCIESNP